MSGTNMISPSHKEKTSGPISAFRPPFLKSGLSEESRLLIARYSANGDREAIK
jgi:hypothetical protein